MTRKNKDTRSDDTLAACGVAVGAKPSDKELDELWEREGLVAQHTLHDTPEAEWDAALRRSYARSVLATYGVLVDAPCATPSDWRSHVMAKADRYANVAAALARGDEGFTQSSVDACRAKLSAHLSAGVTVVDGTKISAAAWIAAGPPPGGVKACATDPASSRMCEHGTKGCTVAHGVRACPPGHCRTPSAPCRDGCIQLTQPRDTSDEPRPVGVTLPAAPNIYDALPPSAMDWLTSSDPPCAASQEWRDGWDACRNRVRTLVDQAVARGVALPAPAVVAWEYENEHGNKFLTHSDPNKWHPHDQTGFKNFRPLTYGVSGTHHQSNPPSDADGS